MKKVLIVIGSVLVALGAAFSIIAAKFEPTIMPNTYVGQVEVGGLSKEEAARKIRIWWNYRRVYKLHLKNDLFQKEIPPMTPGMLGVVVDDEASVAELPMTDLAQAIGEKVSGVPDKQQFDIKFKSIGTNFNKLKKLIHDSVGQNRPATVTYEKGAIVRHPEMSGFDLDDSQLVAAVVEGLDKDFVQVPLKEAAKTVPDEELDKITDVVSEFSTNFPSYQTSRNTNIRLAAAKLNGHVLMPGEEISFNQTVGKRTVEGGFKTAPVLKNGKHDIDIGGGICQVSTTMYNAALLANLKVVHRSNHSLPSAYVAVGRDATVDWGTLDLVLANPTDKPIAITSTFESGRITFRILGQKDPSIKVKIETENHQSWSRGTETIVDKSLKPGTQRVVEKGSSAHSIDTYRIVYKDGVEIRRELISHSRYAGCPRTIAVNPAAAAAPAVGG